MPTFNQLVRKGREVSEKKAKAPALLKGWNSKKRVAINHNSPQKRGVCTAVHLPMQEVQVRSLGQEDPLEEEMATHSSILAWEVPWAEEPGGLQSAGSQKSRTRLSD